MLLPLTLIACIYGMNVPRPGRERAVRVLGVVGLMALMLVVLTVIFRRRGWL